MVFQKDSPFLYLLQNKNSTLVLKALLVCHLCYSIFFSLTSLGVESYVCVLCLIICGVCSLFSRRVWSFPQRRPFTPPQPVASLTAPRHLVPHAPSWTPNYCPRPMLMIDFETRCPAYSLSLPQCKFAKAAKGVYTRIQLYCQTWCMIVVLVYIIPIGLTVKTVSKWFNIAGGSDRLPWISMAVAQLAHSAS